MIPMQDITSPMTGLERRATFSLASIYSLRMLGLFMVQEARLHFEEKVAYLKVDKQALEENVLPQIFSRRPVVLKN